MVSVLYHNLIRLDFFVTGTGFLNNFVLKQRDYASCIHNVEAALED